MSQPAWNSSGALSMGRATPMHNHFTQQRDDNPLGTSNSATQVRGDAAVADLTNFFGVPLKGRQLDFSDAIYEQENEDYPEAFNQMWGGGRDGETYPNSHLKSVLLEKAKASETWQLTIMAPWRLSGPNEGMVYHWSQIKFNSHMLDREPEEAVPRLLSHTRTAGSAGLIRYGIAMLLEANFAATQMGVQMYLMNLEQIRVATVETCSYGAMVAVLNAQPWEDVWSAPWQEAGTVNNMSALNRMFKDECAMWAIVQKDPNGYGVVSNKLKRTMQGRTDGKPGNFTVVPSGMAAYVQASQDKAFYQHGLADVRKIPSLGSETIVDSRPFNRGEHTVPDDPCWTRNAVGDTVGLDDSTLRSVTAADYRTDMLSTMMYNGETDSAEYMLHYDEAYKAVGMYHMSQPNAPLSQPLGQGYARDYGCYTWGQYIAQLSSNPDRIIDGIYRLQGEKRNEFLRTLQLLPVGDPRCNPENCGDRFSPQLFESMLTSDFTWQTFSVAERTENKRKLDMGVWDDGDTAVEMERLDRERSNKRQKRDTRSAQQKYDDYDEYEERKSSDDVYMEDADTGDVTRKQSRTRAYQPVVDQEPTSPLTQLARDMLRNLVAPDAVDAAQVRGDAKAAPATAAETLAQWVLLVQGIKGATDAQRLSLLGELHRVAQHELIAITGSKRATDVVGSLAKRALGGAAQADAKLLHTALIVNFTPLLASCQTRFALNQIGQEQTPLERAMLARGDETDLTDADDAVARAGWWNPSGVAQKKPADVAHEDGQVRLALDAITDMATGVSLPHDSYAATLAAEHNVLFTVDENGASDDLDMMRPLITPGAKQSRTDALTWSIMLSRVAAGKITSTGASEPVDPVTLARLNRVKAARSAATTLAILPCQEHLRNVITTAHKELLAIIKGEKFEPAVDAPLSVLGTPDAITALAACVSNMFKVRSLPTSAVKPASTDNAAIKAEIQKVMQDYMPSAEAAEIANATTEAIPLVHAVFRAAPSSDWASNFRRFQTLAKLSINPADKQKLTDLDEENTDTYNLLLAHYTKVNADKADEAMEESPLVPALVGDNGAPFAWTRANIKDVMFRSSVVCGLFHKFCVENNIALCFALRAWRNAMTYNMACMMYSATVIFRRDWIAIARNIFSNGYIGGAGVSLYDPLNDDHKDQLRSTPNAHDMFVTQVPMITTHGETAGQTWRSMTGLAPSTLSASEDVNQVLSYPGAAAVTNIWGWKTSGRTYGQTKAQESMATANDDATLHQNVICMQGYQMRYNPVTKAYDSLTISSGHWGANVYTGMRDVIDGHKLHFDVPTYMKIRVITATIR